MRLIEVATFTFPNDTDILESLFQSEGIEYYLKDQNSSSIIAGVGTSITVKEDDVQKAVSLIRQAGFGSYLNSPYN